jgi:uncharacterized membrane protein
MNTPFWNRIAIVMGFFLLFAGIMHFVNPQFFNDIVPPWMPPNESFWTYISGVAEIVIAIMLFRTNTRRQGAYLAVALFVAVYPANLYMTWDWRDRTASEQFVSYARLPFQFLFIWAALQIARANPDTSRPVAPGDVVAR